MGKGRDNVMGQQDNPSNGNGASSGLREVAEAGALRWEEAPVGSVTSPAGAKPSAARLFLSKAGLQDANSELGRGLWTGTLQVLGLEAWNAEVLGGRMPANAVKSAVVQFVAMKRDLERSNPAYAHLKRSSLDCKNAHAWLERLAAMAEQGDESCSFALVELVLAEAADYLRSQAVKYNHDGVIDYSEWDALVKDGRRLGLTEEQVQGTALAACRAARSESGWVPPAPPRDDEARRLASERERELEAARALAESERLRRLEAERAQQEALAAVEPGRSQRQEAPQRNLEVELQLAEAQRRVAEEQRRAAEAELRLAEASRAAPVPSPADASMQTGIQQAQRALGQVAGLGGAALGHAVQNAAEVMGQPVARGRAGWMTSMALLLGLGALGGGVYFAFRDAFPSRQAIHPLGMPSASSGGRPVSPSAPASPAAGTTLQVSVKVQSTKANGKPWDAMGGLPDLGLCLGSGTAKSCLPGDKITLPSGVPSLCQDSLTCEIQVRVPRPSVAWPLEVEAFDIDEMANDAMGKGLCELGRSCVVGQAQLVFTTAQPTPSQVADPSELGQPHSGSQPAPDGMLYVPAGTFTQGHAQGAKAEQPVRQVTLSRGFFLDTTEVTVAAYSACVKAGKCTASSIHDEHTDPADVAKWSSTCTAATPSRPNRPITCIDRAQAEAYCRFAGKRLPTEAEWERAARGDDARSWPWGAGEALCSQGAFARRKPDTCGASGTVPPGPEDVGSHPAGSGPYGHLDLAGNTWEWVQDGYTLDAYATGDAIDPRVPFRGGRGTLRGGSWDFAVASSRSFVRLGFPATAGHVSTGVRCAQDATGDGGH